MSGEYYKTKESVDEYIKMADGYNGAELIGKLRRFLPENSAVLELGTGPGVDWKVLSSNYDVKGSDNSTEFLKGLISKEPTKVINYL